MKRMMMLFVALYLLAATARAEGIHGAWTAGLTDGDHDTIHIQLSYGERGDSNRMGRSMDLPSLSGLSRAQVDAAAETPVTFELRREAGVVSFHGLFQNQEGVGHFTFAPSANYLSTIRAMGVRSGEVTGDEDELLGLAIEDVSTDFIRSMRSAGYDVALDQYMTMRIFRVTPELIAEYNRRGYEHIPFDDLIAMRVHKVTPEYIDQMSAAGYPHTSVDNLVASRIHKATPEFIEQLRALGYTNIPFDGLIEFRIHRVTPEIVRAFKDLGYDHLTSSELVEMAIHRVTPDNVHELQKLGYEHLPVEHLVQMAIHRVTPDYIRDLQSAGYSHIPAEKLIEMRIHGIDSDFVKKVGRTG